MHRIIEQHRDEIIRICRNRNVEKLALFGSAAGDRFDPGHSDLDLLVEFKKMTPAEHADQYFGLISDLEQLLGRPVDIVEPGPVTNPYFRESFEKTQVVLYAAA